MKKFFSQLLSFFLRLDPVPAMWMNSLHDRIASENNLPGLYAIRNSIDCELNNVELTDREREKLARAERYCTQRIDLFESKLLTKTA